MAKKSKGTFGVKVSSSNVAGFSNIPGAGSYTVALGRQFADKFKKGVKSVGGPKPPKEKGPKPPKEQPVVIQDEPGPDTPKGTKSKSTKVTSKELEDAVAGGFITAEEATGGEWGRENAAGGGNATYSKKYAANVAANDGVAVGKKFTGVRAGSKTPPRGPNSPSGDTAPIWDKPSTTPTDKPSTTPTSDGSYVVAPEPSSTMLANESKRLGANPTRGKQFPNA